MWLHRKPQDSKRGGLMRQDKMLTHKKIGGCHQTKLLHVFLPYIHYYLFSLLHFGFFSHTKGGPQNFTYICVSVYGTSPSHIG